MRKRAVLLGLCAIIFFSNNSVFLQSVNASDEGTFESFGHVYKSKQFDGNNYKDSTVLVEVMPIFEEIRRAIINRDIELYKKHASSNVIKMIEQYGMKLTDASPVEVVFDTGWEGNATAFMNVTLKYSGESDTQGSPVFIQENGQWKMDVGLGLKH